MASLFSLPVQTIEGEGEGNNARQWHRTRRHIDHGGLELMLRDLEPRSWARNIIRELVAFVSCWSVGETPTVEAAPKLDSEKRIRARLRRLGVIRWWSEA